MAKIRRILAVKLADLGDVLVAEPALRSLRTGHPNAEIHVLTTPGAVELVKILDSCLKPIAFPKSLFDNPRRAISPGNLRTAAELAFRVRRMRFDLVVLFHHLTTQFGATKYRTLVQTASAPESIGLDNGRGDFLSRAVVDRGFGERHEAEYMLAVAKLAGGADVEPAPNISAPVSVADQFGLSGQYAVMFPATGSYSRAREWPASRFAELAQRLTAGGMDLVVLGATDAQSAATRIVEAAPRAIDLTGRTNIGELASIVAGAVVAVGCDTFGGHLAAAVGTPVVSIFGPSNARSWKPYGSRDESSPSGRECSAGIVVREDLPCAPCLYTGYRVGRPEGCPARTCIHTITVDRVVAAVHTLQGAST